MITLDTDFNNPFLHPDGSYFGIIILRPPSQGKKMVSNLFTDFVSQYALDNVVGKVILVYEENIIVRADK